MRTRTRASSTPGLTDMAAEAAAEYRLALSAVIPSPEVMPERKTVLRRKHNQHPDFESAFKHPE